MINYNFFLMLAWLIVLPLALLRILTGKDTLKTILGRFAFGRGEKPLKKTIWCHAASIGEYNTLETLIPKIEEHFPNHIILITTSNIIAHAQAANRANAQTYVAIAPLDFKSVTKRFIRHWPPSALITIENEIFPNRTVLAKKLGLKVIWINARISQKSLHYWLKNADLRHQTVGAMDYVFAQDKIANERFLALGLSVAKVELTENLKKYRPVTSLEHPDLVTLKKVFPYNTTLCAASTHRGEDEIVLDAFQTALQDEPSLKLILVPRHPKRSPELKNLLIKRGLHFAVRSKGELPSKSDQVFLADTMGELDLWYSASAVTFVGGSLFPIGGHTPFEPAACDSAIIHGPYFTNFQDIYESLDQGQGAFVAATAVEISAVWQKLRHTALRETTLAQAQEVLFGDHQKSTDINYIIEKTAKLIAP